jgi:hypothetical protein
LDHLPWGAENDQQKKKYESYWLGNNNPVINMVRIHWRGPQDDKTQQRTVALIPRIIISDSPSWR